MSKVQARLDKLAKIEEKNRKRSRRYIEKAKKDGKKQLSAFISGEAYNQICGIRDAAIQAGKPTSFGAIIEKALACYGNENVNSDDYINTNTNDGKPKRKLKRIEKNQSKNPPPPGDIPDKSDKEYSSWLYRRIKALKDSGMSGPKIAENLNNSGIESVRGKKWDSKNISQFCKRKEKKRESK